MSLGSLIFCGLLNRQAGARYFLVRQSPLKRYLLPHGRENAELVGVSYRLTPDSGERLLGELAEAADELREKGVHFVFGGTPPVAERAARLGFFDAVYDGSQPAEELLAYLKGEEYLPQNPHTFPSTAIDRINWKSPYPILRHHFGLPDFEATLKGIKTISEARVLDVISLGVDQEAQENFFNPEKQNPRRRGAGGVPVRSPQDFRDLFNASRCGNYPLLRTYSGTNDFIRLAEVFTETIHNAWCAIPLFWFNQMDGRGPWDLQGSIQLHQEVMAWYGQRSIPVELNEPHHWGMRDSSDVVFLVSAYLSAYNARAFGVKDYIAQMMFNSPPGLSDQMDLAKMLAIVEMIIHFGNFRFSYLETNPYRIVELPAQPRRSTGTSCNQYLFANEFATPHCPHRRIYRSRPCCNCG